MFSRNFRDTVGMPVRRDRAYDIILFGATGYTGAHTARAIHSLAASGGAWAGVRWAIAGRSQAKLEQLCSTYSLMPNGVLVADVGADASLRDMAACGAVVMNATGPYRFYGEAVVAACIASGTSYVDLCGEPEFIDRCLLKHADAAKAAGVFIVHACAFDSVPADIGCLFTAMQFAPPALCAQADMFHTFSVAPDAPKSAMAHVTTFNAAVHGLGSVGATRKQRKALMDKLEADAPGSSKPPPPLGPRLKVPPGAPPPPSAFLLFAAHASPAASAAPPPHLTPNHSLLPGRLAFLLQGQPTTKISIASHSPSPNPNPFSCRASLQQGSR